MNKNDERLYRMVKEPLNSYGDSNYKLMQALEHLDTIQLLLWSIIVLQLIDVLGPPIFNYITKWVY